MSFLRSLAVFILSFIFVSTVLLALTSYDMGKLIQKSSVKSFIISEGTKYIDKYCQDQCNQDPNERCMPDCIVQENNQIESGMDKMIDEIYQKRFFGTTLDELSSFLSYYLIFAAIAVFSGILLLVASQKPLLTLGKDFITIAISFFISALTPEFMVASVNLPFDLGKAINDYFSAAFSQQMNYAIAFLIAGAVLLLFNYLLKRRKSKTSHINERA